MSEFKEKYSPEVVYQNLQALNALNEQSGYSYDPKEEWIQPTMYWMIYVIY